MQIEPKRSSGLRLKRMLADEWAMIALLGAALVQTGFAVSAMNGVVLSTHENSPAPLIQQGSVTQTASLNTQAAPNALAASTPSAHRPVF